MCFPILYTRGHKKACIVTSIQRETRRVYSLLMEEDLENFNGWTIQPG